MADSTSRIPVPARPDTDDGKTARCRGGHDRVRARMVDINNRTTARRDERLEQPEFSGEIRFEAWMIVEVIARNVGERRRRDAQPVQTILIEPMRRRLDRKMRHPLPRERIERTMQRHGIRRGERAVSFAARRNDADGADARRLIAERCPDLACERSNRRFPAGTGDGGDGRRLPHVKLGGDERQGTSGIAGPHESDAPGHRRAGPALCHNRDGTGSNRRSDEFEPVGLAAFDRHENVARLDRARVGRHSADVEIGNGRLDFGVGRKNVAKLHGGSL